MGLTFLKFAAILMSGVFGFLALIGENRDKRGRFTIWGKVALIGVILATLVAAWTQALEAHNAREAERAENAKTRAVLGEIRRGIYPLFPTRPPEFKIELEFDLKSKVFVHYLSNLLFLVKEAQRLNLTNFTATYPDTKFETDAGTNGQSHISSLSFNSNSPAMPSQTNNIAFNQALESLRVLAYFLRDHSIRTNLDSPDADLEFDFDVVQSSLSFYFWNFDEGDPKLSVIAQLSLPTNQSPIRGNIVTLADLDDAQLWVEFESLSYARNLDANAFTIMDDASLRSFSMTFAQKPFYLTRFKRLQNRAFETFLPTNMLQRDVNLELRTKRRW
jgi:hypothetical protein